MSTTTTNLQLPLFEAGDAVDLLSVYNVAMQRIDSAFVDVATNERIAQIEATAQAAETTAQSAQTAATQAQTNAASALLVAQGAATTASAAAAALDTSNASILTTGDLQAGIVTTEGVVRIARLTTD